MPMKDVAKIVEYGKDIMDKTEKFIKMADCPEIQKCFQGWEDGDFYTVKHGGGAGMVFVWSQGEDEPPEMYKPVWLPRQDQIQTIITKDYKTTLEMICDFYAVVTIDQPMGFDRMFDASWEQHWIAFYMWKKYTKVWKNEKWLDK